MAVVQFSDGSKRKIAPDVANEIWLVLNGIKEPTEQQAKFCEHVEHLYIPWREAPDEYIQQNFDTIVMLHFQEWNVHWCSNSSCLKRGMLTPPFDMSYLKHNPRQWAEKWGLVKYGKITEKGEQYLRKYQPERMIVRTFNNAS